mmetsp:Transcript_37617/g.63308  ORF Transcript_37617/g.63308 Transcript_37617/m.63308 type:complete len:131 (-) Transcript_37617:159-551(-)|eukprot:CAMPEP_0198206604 /NCGR_PEP_ID=MMETSP1445-20131203/10161_1 /TAXON_ID=36898 /ORGANISM="Pyramimonas sp., Strain CCMP2087" /LENGTH=130 /DNA_ID=CAMNT_0043879367 /DNA_START=163 /DNA_END=555 /DNA_ORIENTATION=-
MPGRFDLLEMCRNVQGDGNIGPVKEAIAAGANLSTATGEGLTPLHLAVHNQNVQLTVCLLASGAPKNAQDDSGDTALHIAAAAGRSDFVKLLRDAGASARLRNSDEDTPYDVAKRKGDPALIEALGCWWQ